MPSYSVAVVDDDPLVRSSINCLLRTAGHAVENFESPTAFLDAVSGDGSFDCVLLDENMGPLNGIQTFGELRRLRHFFPAIMVTGVATVELTMDAVSRGFSYVLQKPVNAQELVARVEKYSGEYAKQVDEKIRKAHEEALLDSLSSQEVAVLQHLAAGMLNKQIASQMKVGLRTVETYRQRVMTKVGAECFADAVAFAISVGLRNPGVQPKEPPVEQRGEIDSKNPRRRSDGEDGESAGGNVSRAG